MNTVGGTLPQYTYAGGAVDNGTTMALSGRTSTLSPRFSMGTEALLSMRGWLLKRKNGVFDPKNRKTFTAILGGEFNKRFFWMDSSIRLIYYSESEDKSKRVSFIPFNRVVSVTTVTDPMAINTAKPGWVYGIELRTTDRVYELWARTPAEAKQWFQVMEKASTLGRIAGGPTGMTSFALGGGVGTAHYLDSLAPLSGASRRASSNSGFSQALEEGNTIPVVAAGPHVPGSGDDITVVAAIKENLILTTNAVVRSPKDDSIKAPSKWDDWDR